jgi:hypothetical protein
MSQLNMSHILTNTLAGDNPFCCDQKQTDPTVRHRHWFDFRVTTREQFFSSSAAERVFSVEFPSAIKLPTNFHFSRDLAPLRFGMSFTQRSPQLPRGHKRGSNPGIYLSPA